MIICKCSKSVSKFSIVNSCWLKCKHCSELNLLALISPHIRFSQLNNIVYKQRKNNFLRIFEAAIDTKKDKSLFAPHLVSSKFAFHSRFLQLMANIFYLKNCHFPTYFSNFFVGLGPGDELIKYLITDIE